MCFHTHQNNNCHGNCPPFPCLPPSVHVNLFIKLQHYIVNEPVLNFCIIMMENTNWLTFNFLHIVLLHTHTHTHTHMHTHTHTPPHTHKHIHTHTHTHTYTHSSQPSVGRGQSLTGCGRSHHTGRHGDDPRRDSVATTGVGRGQEWRGGSPDSCAIETTPIRPHP